MLLSGKFSAEFGRSFLELKKDMEERIVILEKEKSSSKELIDQAIEEIKQLRNNKINKTNIDGWSRYNNQQ